MSVRTSGQPFSDSGLGDGGIIAGDVTILGNLTMGDGKQILADPGTASAPGYAFKDVPTNGMHGAGTLVGLCRSGSTGLDLRGAGVNVASVLTAASSFVAQAAFRIASEAVKTANYTATATDYLIILNNTGLTLTLPASPGVDQHLRIVNAHASASATIDPAGKAVWGSTSTFALAAQRAIELIYNGTTWYGPYGG